MSKVYDIITDRVVSLLEQGVVPWQKPWKGSEGAPTNFLTKRPYSGLNVFLLNCFGQTNQFLTFKQCAELGGSVKKGEKGCPVVFFSMVEKENVNKKEGKDTFPMLRYFTVFDVSQCEGLTLPPPAEAKEHNPIASADSIVSAWDGRPQIVTGTQACYNPRTDIVTMPEASHFVTPESYYTTLFHEYVHSTGHEKRLNRKGITEIVNFGSSNYAKEELVAEMGAAFINNTVGILDTTIDQSAAYIAGWLKALKNDKKLVVSAASQAQKAANMILGVI